MAVYGAVGVGVGGGAIPGNKTRQGRKQILGALQADYHCEQLELHPTEDIWGECRTHLTRSCLI